jgi:hypothetical protein
MKNIIQSPFNNAKAILSDIYCASINISGNLSTTNITISSSTVNNECINNSLSVSNNTIIDGVLTVNNEIHNNNTIYCNNLISSNDVLFPYKNIGFIYIGSISYPIIKSCYDTTTLYINLNLRDLLNNNICFFLIYPNYSITFYSANNSILQTIDNTNGTDLLYSQINLNSILCIKFIIKYKNNII